MHRLIVALFLPLVLSGCLVTERDLQVQRDLLELTRRLDNTERNLKLLQDETAGGVKERFDVLTRGQAELQAGLDGLRVDVQGMHGRFDDLARADAGVRQELTLARDEFGLQLADLGARLKKLEEIQAAAATLPAPVASADVLYETALQAIRDRQEFAAGREQMLTFLKSYPADPRAVNAAYWVGETHYAEQAYDKAVLQFEEVVQKYGDDPKVAAALFKQALAFDALKDRTSARLVMKKVIDRFPIAEEAKKAREKLKEWGS